MTWPPTYPRKTGVYLTRLRIGHSGITHKHLLLLEPAPMCLRCHFDFLTIHYFLTDCLCLRNQYRFYFNSSSPTLTKLIRETLHEALFTFWIMKDITLRYNFSSIHWFNNSKFSFTLIWHLSGNHNHIEFFYLIFPFFNIVILKNTFWVFLDWYD